MARLRKPIERETDGYRGLLGRVATPVAQPAAPVAVAPPPAVAAPAVAAPSFQTYLEQQSNAFQPVQTGGDFWSPQMTSFDPAKALADYKAAYGGDKLGWQDYVNTAGEYTPGNGGGGLGNVGNVFASEARTKVLNDWVSKNRPEYLQQGYRVIDEQSGTGVTKDLGNGLIEYRTLNPDGSLGEARTHSKGSSFADNFVKPLATIASIIPSPIQPFAQVLNAGMSAVDGKPIQAALSLAAAANGVGLLDGVGSTPSSVSDVAGSSPYSLGNAPLGEVAAPGGLYDLGNANLGNATGLGGTGAGLSASTDIFNGLGGGMALGSGSALSPSVQIGTPNYDITTGPPVTSPNGEGLSTGPVNGGTGSGLSATPGQGLTLADPGAATGLLGTPQSPSPIDPPMSRAADSQLANEQLGIQPGEVSNMPSSPAVVADPSGYDRFIATGRQLVAAGKDTELYKWVTDPANAAYVKTGMAAGGALLNSVGGSSSGGSSYKDDGYRPTISRGGFQASIPATGTAPGSTGMAPGGFGSGVSLPTTGQANDGLWRYAGNRSQGGFLPSLATPRPQASLISPPYTAPQTGLISPPANYNPRPTGPLPTNVPPMQYGYDDPVPLNRTQLSPEMQRAMSPFLGLLNTSPTRGFF